MRSEAHAWRKMRNLTVVLMELMGKAVLLWKLLQELLVAVRVGVWMLGVETGLDFCNLLLKVQLHCLDQSLQL
ncbi:MAG: hypothetical protein GY774_36270 [Planctomycetes bacterium]|nr:hypothetical protein [Planctomycetota bacterium]